MPRSWSSSRESVAELAASAMHEVQQGAQAASDRIGSEYGAVKKQLEDKAAAAKDAVAQLVDGTKKKSRTRWHGRKSSTSTGRPPRTRRTRGRRTSGAGGGALPRGLRAVQEGVRGREAKLSELVSRFGREKGEKAGGRWSIRPSRLRKWPSSSSTRPSGAGELGHSYLEEAKKQAAEASKDADGGLKAQADQLQKTGDAA